MISALLSIASCRLLSNRQRENAMLAVVWLIRRRIT